MSKGTNGLTERDIQNHLSKMLMSSSIIVIPNYTPRGWYECDLLAVTNSQYSVEYEIKTSVADFRADRRKGMKHIALRIKSDRGPNRFFYVVPSSMLSAFDVPDHAGLVHASWVSKGGRGYDAYMMFHFVKRAPRLHRLHVGDSEIERMQRAFYWRFWRERLAKPA